MEDPDLTTKVCYDYVAAYEEVSEKTVKYGECFQSTPKERDVEAIKF